MSPRTARVVADVLLVATTGAIVYFVLRTPRLRQAAWRTIKTGATVTLPGYLLREVRQAWAASRDSSMRQ